MVLSRPLRIVTVVFRRWEKIGLALSLVLLSTAVTAQDRGPGEREGAALDGGVREGRHVADQVGPQPAPALFSVEYEDRQLSVNAEQTPLAQILREVARQTAVEVQGLEGLQEEVSVRFTRLPLQEGLQKLLGSVNYLLFEATSPQGGMRPTRVLVFGRRAGSPLRARGATSSEAGKAMTEEEEWEERLKALEAFAQQGDEAALRQALHDPDESVQMKALELLAQRGQQQAVASLLDMTKSDQSATRSQALRLLHESGYAGEGTVVAALGAALDDKEARDYAIQALAERGGADAMEYLREVFRDPDPTVRKLVIDNIAPQGQQSLPLLREAIADPDETIRSFARFWLEQAASEDGGNSVSNAP